MYKQASQIISNNCRDGNSHAAELETQLKEDFNIKRDKSKLMENNGIYDFVEEIIKCDNAIIELNAENVNH